MDLATDLELFESSDAFLEAEDDLFDIVPLGDIKGYEGKAMRIKALTAAERDQYDQSVQVQQGDGKVTVNVLNARAKVAALGCVNSEGERIFTNAQAIDLGKKSSMALGRIFEAITKLSGMVEDSEEEEMETFEQGPDSGPSTDSLSSSTGPSPSSSEENLTSV